MPTTAEVTRALADFLNEASRSGLFPIVAYGFQTDNIWVLTTTIPDLSASIRVLRAGTGHEYNLGYSFGQDDLQRVSRANPYLLRLHDKAITSLSILDPVDIGRIVQFFGAPFFKQKAFGLVDIVGFSKLSSSDQLSCLYSLNNVFISSRARMVKFCRRLGLPSRFGRASTGDGFYVWHDFPGGNADVATLTMLLCIIVQSEAMRLSGFHMRLRAAYVIDSSFMFYDPSDLGNPNATASNAIGAATNAAARLSTSARPSQILIGDFNRPGQTNETMNPSTIIAQAGELFREEGFGAATLRFDPDRLLRVTDKHCIPWHCYNLTGEIPNSDGSAVQRVAIGTRVDEAADIQSVAFLDEPSAG